MRTQNDFQVVIIGGRPAMRGDCDFAAAREIESWLMTLDLRPLDIDLSAVTFFDSTALRLFLNACRRNPYIRIVNPSDAVKRVLETTGTYAHLVAEPVA